MPGPSTNGRLTSTSVAEARLFQAQIGERGPEIRELTCISQPSTPSGLHGIQLWMQIG